MTPRGRRLLFAIIAAGTLGRIALAFATVGQPFDIASYRLTAEQLLRDPLHMYGALSSQIGPFHVSRWPYPSGFLPWVVSADAIAKRTGLPLHGVIQLAPIVADAALAWLVQLHLGRRGRPQRVRLKAAALVAFGPGFWLISGYHGQLDSVAILPAVAAVMVWEHASTRRRALHAGVLLGLGATIKTVPALMLLALLPSARGGREWTFLIGSVSLIPALSLAPFLASDFDGVTGALRYSGVMGLGGISLFAQPSVAAAFLTVQPVDATPLTIALYRHASLLTLAGLAAVGLFLLRNRASAVQAAILVWLVFYVISPSFLFQYAVWGLPFFLMAGHLRKVALLQVLLFVPALILYLAPWRPGSVAVAGYVVLMAALWIVWVAATFAQGRVIVRGHAARGEPATVS